MKRLHPHIQSVWRIRYAIWAAIAVIGAGVRDVASWISDSGNFPPPGVLTLIAIVGGVAVILIVPRLRYRYWKYELREEELFLEYGVLTRVRTVVPLGRVQHLDVSQGVLEREFELGRFIVHTAGTRASTVEIPGLHIDEANHLHDTVKGFVVEDAL